MPEKSMATAPAVVKGIFASIVAAVGVAVMCRVPAAQDGIAYLAGVFVCEVFALRR